MAFGLSIRGWDELVLVGFVPVLVGTVLLVHAFGIMPGAETRAKQTAVLTTSRDRVHSHSPTIGSSQTAGVCECARKVQTPTKRLSQQCLWGRDGRDRLLGYRRIRSHRSSARSSLGSLHRRMTTSGNPGIGLLDYVCFGTFEQLNIVRSAGTVLKIRLA